MKSRLDARPVYLQKRETITGHFLICCSAVLLPAKNKNSVSEKLKVILSEDEKQFIDVYRSLNKQGREWVK